MEIKNHNVTFDKRGEWIESKKVIQWFDSDAEEVLTLNTNADIFQYDGIIYKTATFRREIPFYSLHKSFICIGNIDRLREKRNSQSSCLPRLLS
ncbi:hypothetical protein ACFTQ7_18245 [Lysinibacillus sp. NPDC056959]|uniref:hypothetical protein n=1 Tax=Lysinibacillus sp. NPDC056959 TaxID=3345981 RepID=UPI00363E153B